MYETSRTPTVANTNASGTARPTRPTVPCGLMFAAIDGAISAIEMPTAADSERLPRRSPRVPSLDPSIAMGSPPQIVVRGLIMAARTDLVACR